MTSLREQSRRMKTYHDSDVRTRPGIPENTHVTQSLRRDGKKKSKESEQRALLLFPYIAHNHNTTKYLCIPAITRNNTAKYTGVTAVSLLQVYNWSEFETVALGSRVLKELKAHSRNRDNIACSFNRAISAVLAAGFFLKCYEFRNLTKPVIR